MELPKSLAELTVLQYQECDRILKDKDWDEFLGDLTPSVRLLAYLSGKSEDKVLELCTKSDIAKYYKELDFLHDEKSLNNLPLKKLIIANGKVYHALVGMEDFKSGQNLTLKKFEDQPNPTTYLNQMLATMYVPINWRLKPKPYKASLHAQISEDLKHAKLGDVYGLLLFKKKTLEALSPIIKNSFMEASRTILKIMPEVREWAKQNPEILKKAGLRVS